MIVIMVATVMRMVMMIKRTDDDRGDAADDSHDYDDALAMPMMVPIMLMRMILFENGELLPMLANLTIMVI